MIANGGRCRMTKLLFIIGIRRSGTSILRDLIAKHPDVAGIEFEPHDLWAAVDLKHFSRLYTKPRNQIWINDTIGEFKRHGESGRYYGAKFALNPGVKALEWVWLKKTFPEAKFIFIKRDPQSTWNSYVKQDKGSVRGLITKDAYFPECMNIRDSFVDHLRTSILLTYENLLKNADKTLMPIWDWLELKHITGLNKYMKQPEF